MKGNTAFLPRQILYGVVVIALALVAVGSFVDFPLSCALYDASSPFAMFFAAYGAIPAPLGCVAAGTLFVCGRNQDNKFPGMVQRIGGMLLLYQHKQYQQMLKAKGIRQSMSRKGNCLDNAVAENFFGLLKSEMFYLQKFQSMQHFKQELIDYLDYYNNRRIKAKLKGLPPAVHRQQALSVA